MFTFADVIFFFFLPTEFSSSLQGAVWGVGGG